jgi:hypothetical protein
MALVSELKYIQELHDKGGLTDQEYTDAKAALLKPGTQNVGEEKKRSGSSPAVLVGAGVLLLVALLIFVSDRSTKNTQGIQRSTDVELVTSEAAIAGSSVENLVVAQQAAHRHDADAVMAMVTDGRAFLVPQGTIVYVPGYWEDHGVNFTHALVRSGGLIGKQLYMFGPVEGTQRAIEK